MNNNDCHYDRLKKHCPNCGDGCHGKDSLCAECWVEYLGTHVGGRGRD